MASQQWANGYKALWLISAAIALTFIAYWPGLSGSWLFDDYPNIVDNSGVQPHEISVPALVGVALSSPASDFKRPLASLSFAANYLASGLDPFDWKLTNLVIHLLNGVLVFMLTGRVLRSIARYHPNPLPQAEKRVDLIATLIAACWMLLPINLTAVLYVVQREESMANLFVLIGLIVYVAGRQRMLTCPTADSNGSSISGGFWLCTASLILATGLGLLAKETAAMLPLYALLIEWIVFGFWRHAETRNAHPYARTTRDRHIIALFVLVLLLPMITGLVWQIPQVLNPTNWATRDFTLGQRLLSEARIVCNYLIWILLPTPHALSFYHDDFRVSTGLLLPWTTLACLLALATLVVLVFRLRQRQPLAALGIALFLGCQLLTGTILPLELVYEHRNYFASLGLLLAVMPWLAGTTTRAATEFTSKEKLVWLYRTVLAVLMLWWTVLTAITAYAWGDSLRLAQELATRAPDSPRAQYELGRTYIIASHYNPASPFTKLAYAPLEKAASLPGSSILPEQALIFMNARMHLPLKEVWWDSITVKLKTRAPGVQDESSLGSLTQCVRDRDCDLPANRMVQAFIAALSHPNPSARLLAMYSDYAWNVLNDHPLGERMAEEAIKANPSEPAYRITLIRMLVVMGRYAEAHKELQRLQQLNIGGRLDRDMSKLRQLLVMQ